MPKNLFQDMVKVKRERQEEARRKTTPTPVNPRLNERSVLEREAREAEMLESRREEQEAEVRPTTKKKKGGRRYTLWGVAAAAVAVFLFALSFLFAKAEVTVTPQTKDVKLSANLSAVKGESQGLSFDVVSISDEETKTVTGSAQKEISESAGGTVLLYNNFSSASQNLDIDTRLEGSNGKIYKTKNKVTVPGIKNGKPGSVSVKVYANAPGPEYNSGPLDFTVFGFKGTSKYTKFYARSQGSITGGIKGKYFTVAEADKPNIVNELKAKLEQKLFSKATEQIPQGFVLLEDAVITNIDSAGITTYGTESTLPVKLSGTLYGILFDEKALTRELAKGSVNGYDGGDVYIPNISNLNFALSPTTPISNIENLATINFTISGDAKVVWKVDNNKLVTDLVGKSKKSFAQILGQYPNINSANVVLNPFWNRSFPTKPESIDVIVNYPN